MVKVKKIEPKEGNWIYWRWKKDCGDRTFNKSFIQEIRDTIAGELLDLSDYDDSTSYPTRILRKEIYIIKISKDTS